MDNIHKKLVSIQNDLKAPKGQYNDFSKFHYRSCEDILEAVKPLLKKEDLSIMITDKVHMLGDRFYVVSTVMITDTDKKSLSVEGVAREALTKKGMDEAQITGSASSYARKYALNGMFAIDDTKDADTQDNTPPKPAAKQYAKPAQKPVEKKKTKLQEVKDKLKKLGAKTHKEASLLISEKTNDKYNSLELNEAGAREVLIALNK